MACEHNPGVTVDGAERARLRTGAGRRQPALHLVTRVGQGRKWGNVGGPTIVHHRDAVPASALGRFRRRAAGCLDHVGLPGTHAARSLVCHVDRCSSDAVIVVRIGLARRERR